MINKLRFKFIAIAMLAVILVLGSIITIINVVNFVTISNHADERLFAIIDSADNGRPPDFFGERLDWFAVRVANGGNVYVINNYMRDVDDKDAVSYASILYEDDRRNGFLNNMRFASRENTSSTIYAFLDISRELDTFYSFMFACIGIASGGVLLVFLILFFASGVIFKPVNESYIKQKRFITNVSHDIKTPITIIGADTEVLEIEQGENEWTKDIKSQVTRISELTEKLVMLSRLEEGERLVTTEFSLSDAITEQSKSFVGLAETQGKRLTVEIESGVSYVGDEKQIRSLISLLLDNAIKYSSHGGEIRLTMSSGKTKEIILTNPVDQIQQGNLSYLFDRFYRADSSRNSEGGGHGIGLSVAKAIVTAHKGKITAQSQDGKSIKFTINL